MSLYFLEVNIVVSLSGPIVDVWVINLMWLFALGNVLRCSWYPSYWFHLRMSSYYLYVVFENYTILRVISNEAVFYGKRGLAISLSIVLQCEHQR